MQLPLVTHPNYSFDFPAKHRFPMHKFRLLHEHLRQQGIATPANTLRPGPIRRAQLETAHDSDYVERFATGSQSSQELRRMGLPWSDDLVRRSFLAPAGTLLTTHYALSYGIACHLAGGTHHAHRDFASGFCIFNDIAIAALVLLAHGSVKRLLIFDLDVHQGDGTARILADTPAAFTCSLHGAKNFPVRKAHSDLDVELPDGMTDESYLDVVETTLQRLIRTVKPELLIYDAGVDIYAGDPLGRLNISSSGIVRRDRRVLEIARDAGLPVATVIGGGYDPDQAALARRHAIVVEQADRVFA